MDAVEILLVYAPIPLVWGVWCKLWDWTCMWLAIALVVVGTEVASVYGTSWLLWVIAPLIGLAVAGFIIAVGFINRNLKKTISRHYWLFAAESKWNWVKALCCSITGITFFIYLFFVHLLFHFTFLKAAFK